MVPKCDCLHAWLIVNLCAMFQQQPIVTTTLSDDWQYNDFETVLYQVINMQLPVSVVKVPVHVQYLTMQVHVQVQVLS